MNGQRENVQNSKCKKARGDEKMHLSAARCDPNAKRHLEGTGKAVVPLKTKQKANSCRNRNPFFFFLIRVAKKVRNATHFISSLYLL